MGIPNDLKYTKDHEWVRYKDGAGTVGITQFAADQLGDVVFIELPAVGKIVKQSEVLCSIESVKAVSDIYAPLSGKITRVNSDLAGDVESINKDPYGKGWMLEMAASDPGELVALFSSADYESHIGSK